MNLEFREETSDFGPRICECDSVIEMEKTGRLAGNMKSSVWGNLHLRCTLDIPGEMLKRCLYDTGVRREVMFGI